MDCIFCKIVKGEIPSKTYYEDDLCLVTLDIQPGTVGHSLVIPKKHVHILNNDKELAAHLFQVASKVSKILLKVFRSDGTTTLLRSGAVAGQRIPHVSVHIIPRKTGDGLLQHESVHVDTDTRQKYASLIADNLNTTEQDVEHDEKELESIVEEKTNSNSNSTEIDEKETKVEAGESSVKDDSSVEKSGDTGEVDLDEIAGLFK